MKALIFLSFLFFSCSHNSIKPKVNTDNIKPGSQVTIKGKKHLLHKGNLTEGKKFSSYVNKTGVGFKDENKVTVINIVPSIDTPVCEVQTHVLGETKLDPNIRLVTISRDTPMAQRRFAKEAKLENIEYFSDYKYGAFGKRSGLLIRGKELLTRGVIVLDQKGVIQYKQFVSEVTQLPDMNKAFEKANSLLNK